MFGDRLQELREEKGLIQKELGIELEISCRAVQAYENNVIKPGWEKLKAIMRYFKVPAAHGAALLGRFGDRPKRAAPDAPYRSIRLVGAQARGGVLSVALRADASRRLRFVRSLRLACEDLPLTGRIWYKVPAAHLNSPTGNRQGLSL